MRKSQNYMLFKAIIFSNAPIIKGFRYRDRFQLIPYFYSDVAPMSLYATHFPAFLEYEADAVEEDLSFEDKLKEKGFSKDVIKKAKLIPNQERVKREILQLLTCLTNYHLFNYDSSTTIWGIQVPSDGLDHIDSKELEQLKDAKSKWTLGCYVYPGLKKDLTINSFTQAYEYYDTNICTPNYFTNNPGVILTPELSFPQFIEYCLDCYYASDENIYRRIKHCMGLLTDGIALFERKRSVSLLAICSSIEGMASLDYKMYGKASNLGAKSRFTRYLRRYVAGKSSEKFVNYYRKRCDITHESELFVGDLDVYSDTEEQHKDWLLRLEIMQVARLALYNWLIKHSIPNRDNLL